MRENFDFGAGICLLMSAHILSCPTARADEDKQATVAFQSEKDAVVLLIDGKSVASYYFRDPGGQIKRPFFAHVKTMGGIQVTRNHPPTSQDRDDHATMHPGIWFAFGDISNVDFWRNRGRVEHVEFVQRPVAERNVGSFITKNYYVDNDDRLVCEEEFRFAVKAEGGAYLMALESIFSSSESFSFGDQEEMGLGIRVATPMSEIAGGRLRDAQGRTTAKQIWSQSASWCDYSGQVDDQRVGVTLLCHPTNFRGSWFHARNYGLLVANPFGRAAMKKGEPSQITIEPGNTLRLRFGVWVHEGKQVTAIEEIYRAYAKLDR